MKAFQRRLLLAMLPALLLVPSAARADALAVDFESPAYTTGTIDLQDGWSSFGAAGSGCAVYDHGVVSNVGAAYEYPGFADQSLRISNAVTSGCFGDQTFSKSLADEAGEPDAAAEGLSGGTRAPYFAAEWSFGSTTPEAYQPDLSVVASPDRGDGARMSWVQMTDTEDGLAVNFYDFVTPQVDDQCLNGDFRFTEVAAGLDRTRAHTIRIEMLLYDGFSNDVVRVFVDGSLSHVGTSWEDYFRECQLVGGEQVSRTVDSILFRTGGAPAPATAGNGFVIDGLMTESGIAPTAMTARAALAQITPNPELYLFTLQATLTDGTGGGVAGRHVTFSALGSPVCEATTLGNGSATCDALLSAPLIVGGLGYTATFAGDGVRAPATATGDLITL